jgi:hypothetical protein
MRTQSFPNGGACVVLRKECGLALLCESVPTKKALRTIDREGGLSPTIETERLFLALCRRILSALAQQHPTNDSLTRPLSRYAKSHLTG